MNERLIGRRTVLKGLLFLPPALMGCFRLAPAEPTAGAPAIECLPALPSIRFETGFNQSTKDQIEDVFKRIPPSIQNKINKAGYKVVVLESEKAVGARYNNSHIGGVADYRKKEIVIGSPLDFIHELGHVVDSECDDLSMSPEFLGHEIRSAKKGQAERSSLRQQIQDLYDKEKDEKTKKILFDALSYMDKDNAVLVRTEAIASLPQSEIKARIYADGDVRGLVRHLYTPGFEKYYSPDENTRKRFKENDPELYAVFDNFDARMRDLCLTPQPQARP